MNPHPETYDAVSQHHKFYASNARSYDWPPQSKGTHTRPGSCFEGHERPARICMWTSFLISTLGVLTHSINIMCDRRPVLGIVRVRLTIRMRKRLPFPPAFATISPISPARARHAGLAHRTVHAQFEAGARAVAPIWLCGRRGIRRPGGHTRAIAQHLSNPVRYR